MPDEKQEKKEKSWNQEKKNGYPDQNPQNAHFHVRKREEKPNLKSIMCVL